MLGIRLFFIGILASAVIGAGVYVMKLRSDNAILQANQLKLEESVNSQKQVIEQQKQDFASIMEANKQLSEINSKLDKEFKNLDEKFNKINASGEKRDIGDLAVKKTKAIERIINNASDNAQRCVEIAMGSPLTEKEKNAKKKSEINPECPSIANPSYIPY